jgi:heptosyltransferase-3
LVLKLRHIGDVLLATPVFHALKEAYPDAEIYACVNKGTEQVLEGNEDVAGVFLNSASGPKGLASLKSGMGLVRKLRGKKFDLCLDLTTSDRSAILTLMSGGRRRIGFRSVKGFLGRNHAYTDRVQPLSREHVVLKHLKLLEPLDLFPRHPRLHIAITEAQLDKIRALLPAGREYFQVHAISRLAKKNWPVDFMAEAVRHIAQRGWLPVLTGSNLPDEMAQVQELGRRIGEHVNLCGKLSLMESGAVSKNAKCFLGVDTAPMHIAAAAGAPVIALFGPSSEILWAPWCEKKLVLSQTMPCRLPCKDKACKHINCLRTLTPSMSFPAIDQFMNGLPK